MGPGRVHPLVKNPNYWQEGKPYLDSVTWTQVPDDNTRILQLEGGQAHIAQGVPLNLLGLAERKGRDNRIHLPGDHRLLGQLQHDHRTFQ